MSTLNEIKWSLITLSMYEPLAYEDEVNQIFDCIFENKSYDEAPNLDRQDLAEVIEFLGYSDITRSRVSTRTDMEHLRAIANSSRKINKNLDFALRSKIRRILLGS